MCVASYRKGLLVEWVGRCRRFGRYGMPVVSPSNVGQHLPPRVEVAYSLHVRVLFTTESVGTGFGFINYCGYRMADAVNLPCMPVVSNELPGKPDLLSL